MAVLIAEPSDENPITDDWMQILKKLTITTGGLFLCDFSEKRTLGIPKILQGSRFELNSSFYEVQQDEDIQAWNSIVDNVWCYAYLRALGNDQGEFYWSSQKPTYRVVHGGWFHPDNNERAILSARKVNSTTCRTKSLVGRRFNYPRPLDTDGILIAQNRSTPSLEVPIESGWYRVVLEGAHGGPGGRGGNSGTFSDHFFGGTDGIGLASSGQPGSSGSEGETRTFFLWLEEGTVELMPGRWGSFGSEGTNGVNGSASLRGAGDGGDGGNGANGEDSLLLNNGVVVAIAKGGNGGGGGSGGKGGWGWNVTSTGGAYPVHTAEITRRPANGTRGANGNGVTPAVIGLVRLHAL